MQPKRRRGLPIGPKSVGPGGMSGGYRMHYEATDAGTLHTIAVIDGPGLPAHARDDLARLSQEGDDLREMLDLCIPF